MTRDQYENCRNCGGMKCMGCVMGEVHKECADDCPECCNPQLFDVEIYRPAPQSTAYQY